MTRELFSAAPRAGPTHTARESDTLLFSLLFTKASFVPILNNTHLVLCNNPTFQAPPNLCRAPSSIPTRPRVTAGYKDGNEIVFEASSYTGGDEGPAG